MVTAAIAGPRADVLPDLADDLAGLQRFRGEHPEVRVGIDEYRHWQAVIPEPSGETVVVRHTLADLLARLAWFFPDEEIIRLYQDEFLPTTAIARKTGKSVPEVRRVLRQAGIEVRRGPRRRVGSGTVAEIIRACTDGMTYREAARRWGVGVATVQGLIAAHVPGSLSDGLLRSGEAARVAGISRKELGRLAAASKVPSIRATPTANRLYRRCDMEALAAAGGTAAPDADVGAQGRAAAC